LSTLSVPAIPLQADSPAQRLRRIAAAVRVSLHWWGVHRSLSPQQKEEVGLTYAADARLVTAGKKLLDTRHEAFRRLTSIKTRLTNYWRGISLPYTEPGIRLICQSEIDPFVHTMAGFREELAEGETELGAAYDEIKADSRRRLGRLYDPADYPTEVRGLFAVEWDFPSVEPPSYLMRLNPDVYRQEQERVSRRFEEAVRLAEQAFLEEFVKLVGHLSERLTADTEGERKIFRDTAITNLTGFFERFRHLSVGSSAQLDELVNQAQQLVQGVSPQSLRDDNDLRRQVAGQLGQVQAQLDGMLVDVPRRRIIRASSAAESR
jgi:hypothetical protein